MPRRFRFNWLDLLVLLVLLVGAAVVFTRLGPASSRPEDTRQVTFTVMVSRAPAEQAEGMFSVGDVLYSASGQPAAQVIRVEVRPSPIVLESGGFFREGESRYFRDVLVTATGEAVKVQNHYELRNQPLQIGRDFTLASPRTLVRGVLVDVRW